MTADDWNEVLGFDFDGAGGVRFDGDNIDRLEEFNREEAVHEIRRPGANRPILYVGQLTVNGRILFYVITHILFPRAYNHSRVLEGDIPIMWAIRHGINVNWMHFICNMMYKAKMKDTGALPFAYLVQGILEHFGVPMTNEKMVRQKAWNAQFGQRLLEQCKIAKGPNGVWQYTNVEEELPDAGLIPPVVDPELHEDDDDDADMEDFVVPEGGFSLDDVMKAIYANTKQNAKMKATLKKWRKSHIEKQNERWRWMQGRMKGIEDRLGQLQLGREQEVAGDDDQGAPSEEEADTSEEEA